MAESMAESRAEAMAESMAEIEHVLSLHNHLGEGPIWSPKEQTLYWVDIPPGVLHSWKPATKEHRTYSLGYSIGCLGLRARGGLILATKQGIGFWDEGNGFQPIHNPNAERPGMRFNDGKVDPAGRLFAGTMRDADAPAQPGFLYRLDADLSLHTVESGLRVSNGIGWSLDHAIMYFTDTGYNTIFAYDYDQSTGNISGRRPFVVVPQGDGHPDGMTVDSEGFIWSCHWQGWRITRYDPAGKIERVIKVPVERPTAVAFGGKDLDELYFTSAAQGAADLSDQPWAGDLLMIRAGVKGQAEPEFAG
jgi:sugar lactone lactonase YvrE